MSSRPGGGAGVAQSFSTREAGEGDVAGIAEIFGQVYGSDYPYRGFLDHQWLKRSIFSDDIVTVVAEDLSTKRLVGTASVVLDIGAESDLLGELGRLAVVREAEGRGVGRALMAHRISLCADRLHVALVENRTAHTFSQRISEGAGFHAVGLLPSKHEFRQRESMAVYARHFGDALSLRRNHPRLVPEAHALAFIASENCGLDFDGIVDEESLAYPHDGDFAVEALSAAGYPRLLRIERGRTRRREVFGPLGLHQGFFKLSSRHAEYLVARRPAAPGQPSPVAGAIGFRRDVIEHSVRVLELIAISDAVVPVLFDNLLERCQREWNTAYVEVDVSADATRLQRTLIERGFIPAAFIPAMVFCDVERLDVLKLARVFGPTDVSGLQLTDEARAAAAPVLDALRKRSVFPALADALDQLPLFSGLRAEQANRVASACQIAEHQPGEHLFDEGAGADAMYILLQGSVNIQRGAPAHELARRGPGEVVGELALMLEEPHSATATAANAVTSARLSREQLEVLSRQRPDIAVLIYKNLSIGLGRKLWHMSDAALPEI